MNPPPVVPPDSAANDDAQSEKNRARGRVGKTVKGKWRLDALLGVGGMASVYAATHRNGSRAALKILHAEYARDANMRERFLREGYVANRIDHPGRVAILDDDESEEGEAFLVMELLDGETVQDLWKRKHRRVPVQEALWIADQVLGTLACFHAEGIIHRDLKPANIFVTRERVVKILDFGVARSRDTGGDKTRAGTALGTPSYMSPEQAMGLIEGVDGRADLFSVGATLFAILGGQRLHQGRSDNEAFILAATTPAPSLARIAPTLPVPVIALVDRALAWDKRARFENALAMQLEIRRVLQLVENPVESSTSSRGRSTERPSETARAPTHDGPATSVGPTDLVVAHVSDVFRRLERVLVAARQHGPAHAETEARLRVAFQGVLDALRDGDRVGWSVAPYGFSVGEHLVWEPAPPLDAVPYHLFAAGVRGMALSPGLTEDELQALVSVMLLDPAVDLAPEDDLAAALWERQLEHVHVDAVDAFAEGDAAARDAFLDEADALEADARRAVDRIEAAAMPIGLDAAASDAAREAARALGLDPAAKAALAAQLETAPDRFADRFVDVMAAALLDAYARGDATPCIDRIATWARSMVFGGRSDRVVATSAALARSLDDGGGETTAPLRRDLLRRLFSPDTFRRLVREASRPEVTDESLDALAAGLAPVLDVFEGEHVGAVLDALDTARHAALRAALVTTLERLVVGRETEVASRLGVVDPETGRALLAVLAAARTPAALAALRHATTVAPMELRCDAAALLASDPDVLRELLAKLTDDTDGEQRLAALRAVRTHRVRAAGPLLARKVQDASFPAFSIDERRATLEALFLVNAARAEVLCVALLDRAAAAEYDPFDETCSLAVESLGRHARSIEALQAVVGAMKRRARDALEADDPASSAANAIAARCGKRLTASGEIA